MCKRIGIVTSLFVFFILLTAGSALAAVPQTINYQGNLTDKTTGAAIDGSVSILFTIYDASSGGTDLWHETQTVVVSHGLFSVTLGSGTPINLPFDAQYYLGVKVGSDAEMTPRQVLTSVGYAFKSETANSVTGTVGLANGGTGATTASAARTALGAAASGSNSDITALSGLTTALSVGQGGTGATSVAGARSALSAAASGANTDITQLSGLTTPLSIGQGGTGATAASTAINNLLPSQGGNGGKFLTTNGTSASWGAASGGGVDGLTKVVHGCVAANGNITSGAGFAVMHSSDTGVYTIAFSPPFSSLPTITATVLYIDPYYDNIYFITWSDRATSNVAVHIVEFNAGAKDQDFCFSAMN